MSFTTKSTGIIYTQNDKELGHATYHLSTENQNTIVVTSTFVDPSLRGQGIAAELMDHVVLYAREQQLKVIPTCSYAVDWFEKHPEAHDLLAQ